MQDSHRAVAPLIVVVFTILQLLLLVLLGYTPYHDSNAYIEVAREAMGQGGLYPTPVQFQNHAFLWNIGAIQVVQWSLQWFQSVTPLLILYALMKGLTAWLFYLIVRSLCGNRTALLALLIYVLYPANYGECTSLLSELPFMCLAMEGVCACVCYRKPLVGGLLLALANYFRPMGLVFLVALVVYYLFNKKEKTVAWLKTYKPISSLLLSYVFMLFVLASANRLHSGHYIYQAKTGWMALTSYSYDHAAQSFSENPRDIHNDTTLNVAQKDRVWREMFLDWVLAHPTDYAAQMPSKLAKTYISDNVNMCAFLKNKSSRPYLYEELSLSRLLKDFPRYTFAQFMALLNLLIYYAILVLSLLGLRHFRCQSHLLPLAVILLGTLLLLFAGHGEARFHIPFMPFFILLAASFFSPFPKDDKE